MYVRIKKQGGEGNGREGEREGKQQKDSTTKRKEEENTKEYSTMSFFLFPLS